MAILSYDLPSNSPNFTFPVVLSGVEYLLNFKWNFRELAWYLTIRNPSGVDLISNIKVVPMINLLGQYVDKDLPHGIILVVPIGYPKIPTITYENLTTDFYFTYTDL